MQLLVQVVNFASPVEAAQDRIRTATYEKTMKQNRFRKARGSVEGLDLAAMGLFVLKQMKRG